MTVRNFAKKILVVGMFAISSISLALASAEKNIVETAKHAGGFSRLVKALKFTALDKTLEGEGPFTVFAPTDAAFKKFDKANPGLLTKLMQSSDGKEKIKDILLYHVVKGKVTAKEVMEMTSGKSINDKDFTVSVNGDKVQINDAKVIKTDIMANNGIIHVIDTVLMPSSEEEKSSSE